MPARTDRLRDALTYLRGHGARAFTRKFRQLYVYNRERIYVTRGDIDRAIQRPLGRNGVEVRLARADDLPRFAAFPRLKPRTVQAWLGPEHYVLLAMKDGAPAGYRWLSRRVASTMAPVLHLQPDQLFSMMSFVARSFRRQGIHTELKTATGHLLGPLGFRQVWGSQSPLNHVVHEVTHRPTNITGYVGTLTRRSLLGRVRFSFAPTTALSSERVAGPVEVLAAMLGGVRRVEILLNRVSVLAAPDVLEGIGADLRLRLGVTAVRETVRQADELREAFDRIAADRPDALLVLSDPMLLEHRRTIVALAAAHRLPTAYEGAAFAAAGGLLACGAPVAPPGALPDGLRRVTTAPDPIRLLVNRATARRLGLAVPPSLLQRADRVLDST